MYSKVNIAENIIIDEHDALPAPSYKFLKHIAIFRSIHFD